MIPSARLSSFPGVLLLGASVLVAAPAAPKASPTTAEVLAATKPSDWRPLDPENTLYMELPGGRVVIELAPAFAPEHVANIKKLVRDGYFDGLAIIRSQDNYVVQWGDPKADDKEKARPVPEAQRRVPAEWSVPLTKEIGFSILPERDGYAPEVGFAGGFPAAADPKTGRVWLAHCYGMIGVGRGDPPDSGNGTELYAVNGNAPRHLDRNTAVVGRVVWGMERLSTQPRGSGALGFYEKNEHGAPIRSVRVAADVPAADRIALEVLRTDTPSFRSLIESRRNRRESWFRASAGYVSLCNVPIPVRQAASEPKP
jgi:cyclophilin family peptidyl-prolyl cis-trans isomerase